MCVKVEYIFLWNCSRRHHSSNNTIWFFCCHETHIGYLYAKYQYLAIYIQITIIWLFICNIPVSGFLHAKYQYLVIYIQIITSIWLLYKVSISGYLRGYLYPNYVVIYIQITNIWLLCKVSISGSLHANVPASGYLYAKYQYLVITMIMKPRSHFTTFFVSLFHDIEHVLPVHVPKAGLKACPTWQPVGRQNVVPFLTSQFTQWSGQTETIHRSHSSQTERFRGPFLNPICNSCVWKAKV